MNRLTVVVDGPLAFQMRRWEAVTRRENGAQICTLPMLAARLAGGFHRPVRPEELQPAVARALTQGGFLDLESMRDLPEMTRAVARTLSVTVRSRRIDRDTHRRRWRKQFRD